MSNLANQTSKIIYHNIPYTPSKVGVVAGKTFSHTPDEAMSDGLAKACDLGKRYSVKENISYSYSDYLRAAREAEREDLIELSQSSRIQTADSLSKPRTTSFFPLRKLKQNQSLSKKPAVCLAQLEEEEADDSEDLVSDDSGGIEGVLEEFMVQLARAVKDAQVAEKCCYHCSSPEHFIRNCQLMKAARDKKQLNGKDGTATTMNATKSPQKEAEEV